MGQAFVADLGVGVHELFDELVAHVGDRYLQVLLALLLRAQLLVQQALFLVVVRCRVLVRLQVHVFPLRPTRALLGLLLARLRLLFLELRLGRRWLRLEVARHQQRLLLEALLRLELRRLLPLR